MPLLFIDYTNLVIKFYEEKRKANKLSRLLMHPTTANIRQECLNVFHERMNRGEIEEDVLRSFFGVPSAGRNFDHIIERHHADKFRPLRSFIKGRIRNPSLVNVEMLAWLIDFKPRPLAYAQKVLGFTNDISTGTLGNKAEQNGEASKLTDSAHEKPGSLFENIPTLSKDNSAATLLAETKKNTNNKNLIIFASVGLVLTILFVVIYFQQYQSAGQTAYGNTNTGCMYWAYDHYEQVPCNEERKGRLFLPLEKEKIKSFRMITRKDTITEWSIEKIYYIKDNNKIKYYTEPGNFPEDINRTLKRLSPYIFAKDSVNRKNPE